MKIARFGAMDASQLTKHAFVKDNTLGLTLRVLSASKGEELNAQLRQSSGKLDAKLKLGERTLEDNQFLIIGTVIKGPTNWLGKVLHHIVGSETQDGKTIVPQLDLETIA